MQIFGPAGPGGPQVLATRSFDLVERSPHPWFPVPDGAPLRKMTGTGPKRWWSTDYLLRIMRQRREESHPAPARSS